MAECGALNANYPDRIFEVVSEPTGSVKAVLELTKPSVTLTPVTVSGWYENTDGTVTFYHWQDGQLIKGRTVNGWSDVSEVV